MKVRAFMVMAALAGCGQPTPLACFDNAPCLGGVCVAGSCANQDDACASGYRYDDSAGQQAGECTMAGNGSGSGSGSGSGEGFTDQVMTLPLDGTALTVPAANAQDDVNPGCGVNGADVMFEARVLTPGVLYVDTQGTSFDAVLAVYDGTCANAKTRTADACIATGPGSCTPSTKIWATLVNAGTYCVVVDQATNSTTHATVGVHAKLGPPAPPAQMGTNSGSTCAHDDWPENCTGDNGGDATWFLMSCGGTYDVDLLTPSTWAGDLQAYGLEDLPLVCDASGGALTVTLTRPGPVWIVAHEISTATCEPGLAIDIY